MLQLKNHALAGRELVQSMVDARSQFAAHQVALGVGAGPDVGNLAQDVIGFALRIHPHRSIFLAHLLLPQVVQAKIGHDAVDPGVEGALEAEVAHALVRLQKGILINVLGFVLRPGEVHGQPEDRLVVVPHQLLEGGAIAALRFADQQRVINTA